MNLTEANNFIRSPVRYLLVVFVLLFVGTHVFAFFADTKWWIEYTHIEAEILPFAEQYTDGLARFRPDDDITLDTVSTLKQFGTVKWVESLLCFKNGRWRHVQEQEDEWYFSPTHKNMGIVNRRGGFEWRERLPDKLSICLITHRQDILLPLGAIVRGETNETGIFVVNWVDSCGTRYLNCFE